MHYTSAFLHMVHPHWMVDNYLSQTASGSTVSCVSQGGIPAVDVPGISPNSERINVKLINGDACSTYHIT